MSLFLNNVAKIHFRANSCLLQNKGTFGIQLLCLVSRLLLFLVGF